MSQQQQQQQQQQPQQHPHPTGPPQWPPGAAPPPFHPPQGGFPPIGLPPFPPQNLGGFPQPGGPGFPPNVGQVGPGYPGGGPGYPGVPGGPGYPLGPAFPAGGPGFPPSGPRGPTFLPPPGVTPGPGFLPPYGPGAPPPGFPTGPGNAGFPGGFGGPGWPGPRPVIAAPWPNFGTKEKEPMLLLDVTGSMNYGASETDSTPRKETVREAINLIVRQLSKHDSQAVHEVSGGGLRTVTFAGGRATDLEDLNSRNLKEKWASIKWAGATKIMPGWRKLMEVYNEEFGSRPPANQPLLMVLIITDGEADDSDEFTQTLNEIQKKNSQIYVTLAIIGYGTEHDDALASYQKIASSNSHVRVVTLGSETNPEMISQTLLKMVV